MHALQSLTACLAIKRKRAERACRVVKVLGIDMVDRDAHGLALVHSDALAVLGVARVPCGGVRRRVPKGCHHGPVIGMRKVSVCVWGRVRANMGGGGACVCVWVKLCVCVCGSNGTA